MRGQISKTDFYDFLNEYEKKELIVRPTRGLIQLVQKPGFWERRVERKRKERREHITGALAWFEYRAEHDGIGFFKKLVEKEKDSV